MHMCTCVLVIVCVCVHVCVFARVCVHLHVCVCVEKEVVLQSGGGGSPACETPKIRKIARIVGARNQLNKVNLRCAELFLEVSCVFVFRQRQGKKDSFIFLPLPQHFMQFDILLCTVWWSWSLRWYTMPEISPSKILFLKFACVAMSSRLWRSRYDMCAMKSNLLSDLVLTKRSSCTSVETRGWL